MKRCFLFNYLSVLLGQCLAFFLFVSFTKSVDTPVRLLARDAVISGKLRIEDKDEEKATIHGLHNVTDSIYWTADLKKGNYKVSLRYSEPYVGAVVSFVIGNRQFSSLMEPTAGWHEYVSHDVGVVSVAKSGKVKIVLKGVQLSLKDGKPIEALPDFHWVSLDPTSEKETFGSLTVLEQFKGKKLFDGKTFAGWEGNNGAETMNWFRIEDGCIVGGMLKNKIPKNEFLRTVREYENFELRLQFKMNVPEGSKSWNAGIQFRSQKHPTIPYEMVGYQADIIPWKWGGVFDEQRRWDFLGNLLQTNPKHSDIDWNSYVIRCEGPRFRIWVNNELTMDYTEPYAYTSHPKHGKIPLKGYIALQIHEDVNPAEVWYKNIELQEFK